MKKFLIASALVLVVAVLLFPIAGRGQMGPGMMGRGYMMGPGMMGPGGYGGWYCPYCGQYMGPGGGYGMGPGMMGPGMMGPGYGGHMMGPGMMGPGMMGPGYGPYQFGPQYQQPREPLKEKDVKQMLENYLQSTRNPNLKLGKITEKNGYFEAEILTKNNALVDKIIVDKYSGWMRSMY
jgi:hypothetical protein